MAPAVEGRRVRCGGDGGACPPRRFDAGRDQHERQDADHLGRGGQDPEPAHQHEFRRRHCRGFGDCRRDGSLAVGAGQEDRRHPGLGCWASSMSRSATISARSRASSRSVSRTPISRSPRSTAASCCRAPRDAGFDSGGEQLGHGLAQRPHVDQALETKRLLGEFSNRDQRAVDARLRPRPGRRQTSPAVMSPRLQTWLQTEKVVRPGAAGRDQIARPTSGAGEVAASPAARPNTDAANRG